MGIDWHHNAPTDVAPISVNDAVCETHCGSGSRVGFRAGAGALPDSTTVLLSTVSLSLLELVNSAAPLSIAVTLDPTALFTAAAVTLPFKAKPAADLHMLMGTVTGSVGTDRVGHTDDTEEVRYCYSTLNHSLVLDARSLRRRELLIAVTTSEMLPETPSSALTVRLSSALPELLF